MVNKTKVQLDNLVKHGCVEDIEILYKRDNKIKRYIDNNKHEYFKIACSNDKIQLAKWLYSIDKTNNNCEIQYACQHNKLELVKWINSISEIDSITKRTIFDIACKNNYLEMAKWIYSVDKYYNIDYELFKYICVNGNVKVAKWALESNIIKPKYFTYIFRHLYKNEHIDIFNMLCSTISIDNDDLTYCFLTACKHGQNKFVDTALSTYKKYCYEYSFHDSSIVACRNGHLGILKLLFSLNKSNFEHNNMLLEIGIQYQEISVLYWLISTLEDINLDLYKDNIFELVYKKNEFNIMKFLIDQNYEHYYKYIFKNRYDKCYKMLDDIIWNKRKHAIVCLYS